MTLVLSNEDISNLKRSTENEILFYVKGLAGAYAILQGLGYPFFRGDPTSDSGLAVAGIGFALLLDSLMSWYHLRATGKVN